MEPWRPLNLGIPGENKAICCVSDLTPGSLPDGITGKQGPVDRRELYPDPYFLFPGGEVTGDQKLIIAKFSIRDFDIMLGCAQFLLRV
jgi:hypothetical protein